MTKGRSETAVLITGWKTVFRSKIFTAPFRFLFSSDLFISYARSDGASSAQALANALVSGKNPLSCTFDHWETRPGKAVPPQILRTARNARGLVVVASSAAAGSKAMDAEIAAFLRKQGPIVLITFPGCVFRMRSGIPDYLESHQRLSQEGVIH
jgi:hypothetical protein